MVAVRVARPMRAWHACLVAQLEAGGVPARLELFDVRQPTSAAGLVLAAERFLYRSARMAPQPSPASRDAGQASLTIAIDGVDDGPGAVVEPLFDGQPGEVALTRALLQGRAPRITIRMRSSGEILATGLPAIEDPACLTRSMRQVYARLGGLLLKALRRSAEPASRSVLGEATAVEAGQGGPAAALPKATSTLPKATSTLLKATSFAAPYVAAAFLARGVAGKLSRRLGPARGRPDHWRIGYRLATEPGVAQTLSWSGERYISLPDDGERFFADPFAFEHEGRRFIVFEDFSYASNKGVISLVEIDAHGRASAPRMVLEQPVHLSYPFVMHHEGGIVMLPETSGARRVQLFRADPFPDRWVPAEILLHDIVAADATPIWHDGSFWLFATLADDGGSSWDQLCLFHAPALTGPWRPHADNPVVIDAGAARPAGAMWHENGVLMRVAQDCRAGYGGGLAICRVDRLDEDCFAQTVIARLAPPEPAAARGIHTLNRCAGLEVIDLKVDHPTRPRV